MWDLKIWGIEFFDIFYNFFIYCFIGWIYESTYVSIKQRQWVNRGFLNGPVIPIYGCAATLLYIAFFNERMLPTTLQKSIRSILIIFIAGMLLASALEFVTSWVMEKLFHAKWWDYSNIPLNIQGRICLPVALFWGLLSVAMAELIQPQMDKLVAKIPRHAGEIAGYVIFTIFAADFVMTVAATLQLDKKVTKMQKLREDLAEALEKLRLYETKEELREKLADSPVYEYFGNKKSEFEQNVEKWLEKHKASLDERAEERSKTKEEFRARLEEFSANYQKQKSNFLNRFIYRRIFKAFPNMKTTRSKEAFADFKERIRHNKKYSIREEEKENEETNDK